MRMCFNKNVLIGLGVVAAALFLIEPSWLLATVPILIVLACPLSMLLMMRGMGRSNSCTTEGTDRAVSSEGTDEVAHLRAEIADLRAALHDREDQPAAVQQRQRRTRS